MSTILVVAANLISSPDAMLRTHKDDDAHVITLAEDLAKNGQLSAVRVVKDGDMYIHEDGACRLTATRVNAENGIATKGMEIGEVIADVSDYPSEDAMWADLLARQIRANAHVKATGPRQYADSINRMHTDFGMSVPEISEAIGLSTEMIYRWLRALRLPENVMEMLKNGEITLVNAAAMAKVYGQLDEDLQEKVLANKALSIGDFKGILTEVTDEMADRKTEATTEVVTDDEGKPVLDEDGKPKRRKIKKEKVFEAKKTLLGKTELLNLLDVAVELFETEPNEYNRGRLEALQEIFNVHPAGIEAQQADYQAKLAAADARKKQKAIEAAQKAKEEADNALASLEATPESN